MRIPSCRLRLALAALLVGLAVPVAADDEAPLPPQQLSAHAWMVQGESAQGSRANDNFISNAGFVVTPAGVVVVDALGSPRLGRRLLATIARVTPQPVVLVVATHYHADHVYGLQALQAAGARIVAERHARAYLGSDTAKSRLESSIAEGLTQPDTRLVAADTWLDGSASMEVGGMRLELLHVGPAHTAEDLALFVPAEGVLYAGDVAFRGRVPWVGQADSRRWIASLNRLLALPARIVVPGHGPPSTDPRADLQLTRDYLAYLRATMGPAAKALVPFEEAYAATDWSRFEQVPLFRAANHANAYNTYLLMETED
jgi:glyoxylase-like metal-dependent hydrolase (beta-lactamase superfamily II)